MVTVKTSYYAKAARGVKPSSKLVVVSNSYPTWFNASFELMKNLAPAWADVEAYKNDDISFKELTARYKETLMNRFDSIDNIRDYVFEKVRAADGDEIILLCWEKDSNKCHRTELANLVFPNEYQGEL